MRNNDGRFRKNIATGLVSLLLLGGLLGCVARYMPDWSKVRVVAPDTKTEAPLYEGERKIKGRFLSATDDAITLHLTDRTYKDGLTRTFQKSTVCKVLTRRPISKRWPGWTALGFAGVLNALFMNSATDGSENAAPGHLVLQGAITLPLAIGFLFGSRMGGIYEVPPEHRDWHPKGPNAPAAAAKDQILPQKRH